MRRKINDRILANYMVCVMLVGVVAVFTYFELTKIIEISQIGDKELEELNITTELEINVVLLAHRLERVVSGIEHLSSAEMKQLIGRLRLPLGMFDTSSSSGHVQGRKGSHESHNLREMEMRADLESQIQALEALAQKLPKAGPEERSRILGQMATTVQKLHRQIQEKKAEDQGEARRALLATYTLRKRSLLALLTVVSVAFLLSLFLGFRFARGISQPIEILRRGATRISQGDLQHRINVQTGDELELFANEFNEMAHRLSEVYEKQQAEIESRTRQLVHSEKLAGIGTLAAGVAHEINNPLASVAGYAEALRRRVKDGDNGGKIDLPEFAEYLDVIAEEVYRCKEIIRNLLDFSRQSEFVFAPVDIHALIRKTCQLLQHQSDAEKKQINLSFSDGALTIEGDESQLRHALFNVLRNAIEAIEDEGVVNIRTGVNGSDLDIEIEDSGRGIDPREQSRIFEPFYSTKPPGEGTGLGLAMCYGIIESHQGTLKVRSEGKGKGCLVTITLPLTQESGKSSEG